MTINDVITILLTAERTGPKAPNGPDDPEGSMIITISHTLAILMAQAISDHLLDPYAEK